MTLREKLVHVLVWLTALAFAFMVGGNLFEQTVIIPYYGDDPPATLQFWEDILESGHFTFYGNLGPLCILTALVSLLVGWRSRDLRPWLVVAFVSILIQTVMTFTMAVPYLKVLGFFPPAPGEVIHPSVAELKEAVAGMQLVSAVRWTVHFIGLLALLRALILSAPPRHRAS